MKVQENKTEIQRTGVSESKGFAIKASAQAFRILSDGLYSDKILAVIRELGSNAWDAHVSAGTTDRPFDVHLPNNIEPWYSIRDYGTGLSHEDVMTLYSTYFDSTKDKSNDFTGAMGLGSKSPFSYVDSFTVTSVFDGKKSIYMVDIGEEGIPNISLVAGSPFDTSEHPGMEVKLAVKRTDFRDFQTKAERIFKRYPLVPNVVGNLEFAITKDKVLYEGTNWRILKPSRGGYGYHRNDSYAIQGTVAYPINLEALQQLDYNDRRAFESLHCEMDFAIGDLEVSASREELGYTEQTSANIVASYRQMITELSAIVADMIKDAPSRWDAQCIVNKLANEGSFSKLISNGTIPCVWNDEVINYQNIRLPVSEKVTCQVYAKRGYNGNASIRRYNQGNPHKHFELSFDPRETTIVVNNIPKKGVARHKHYADTQGIRSGDKYVLVEAVDNAALNAWLKEIGYEGKKPVLTSTLPDAPKETVTKKPSLAKTHANLVRWNKEAYRRSMEWTATYETDLSTVKYIVKIYSQDLDPVSYPELKHFSYKRIINYAKTLGLIPKDAEIYGVNRTNRSRVAKGAPKAKDVIELVKAYVLKNRDRYNQEKLDRADSVAFDAAMSRQYQSGNVQLFKTVHDQKVSSPEINAFFSKYIAEDLTHAQREEFSLYASALGVALDAKAITGDKTELTNLYNAMTAKYPMLKTFASSYFTSNTQMLIEYVNLVNKYAHKVAD